MFVQATPNAGGAYPAPQSHYAPGLFYISDELTAELTSKKGFVKITGTMPGLYDVNGQLVETYAIVSLEENTEALEAWETAEAEKAKAEEVAAE